LKRITRTITVFAATAAAIVAFNPAANAATTGPDLSGYTNLGTVTLDGGTPTTVTVPDINPVGILLDTINKNAHTCVPSGETTTIADASATVYYSALDSFYYWQDPVVTQLNSCTGNKVTVSATLSDQALDDASAPTVENPAATGSGTGSAGTVGTLFVNYNNITMATGLDYHTLTMTVQGTQTDGKTTTAWCANKSWTYLATLAGPEVVGSTPTAKCGS